jgi:transcription initiation factor IIE alpha subunit
MDMDTDAGNDEANLEEVKCSKCGEVLGWIQTIDVIASRIMDEILDKEERKKHD